MDVEPRYFARMTSTAYIPSSSSFLLAILRSMRAVPSAYCPSPSRRNFLAVVLPLLPFPLASIVSPALALTERRLWNDMICPEGVSLATDKEPRFLGSGASGSVYAFERNGSPPSSVVVKVSSETSAAAVEYEFKVVQYLQSVSIPNVETPIALCPVVQYNNQNAPRRTAAVYTPEVQGDITGSIAAVQGETPRARAARATARTIIAMLCEGIVSTDLQILANEQTGSVLFVDFTEAAWLSDPPTNFDQSRIAAFLSEAAALIPPPLFPIARAAAQTELIERLVSSPTGRSLHPVVRDLLQQSQWELPRQ